MQGSGSAGCLQPLGIRAVIVTNVNVTEVSAKEAAEHLETWTFWPDMGQGAPSTPPPPPATPRCAEPRRDARLQGRALLSMCRDGGGGSLGGVCAETQSIQGGMGGKGVGADVCTDGGQRASVAPALHAPQGGRTSRGTRATTGPQWRR